MEKPHKALKTEKLTQPDKKACVLESLYSLCIQYVAMNLQMVESFRGFPELVAADIFKEADKLSKFDILTQPHRNMELFCEVYPNNVLSSLNISSCHVALNYSVKCFETFSGLHSLDVSSCFLGDDHEFLSHIAHLKCLINLNLRKNSLSDKGVRNLYAPFTLFKRGPEHLKVLDISENGCISEKSVKKLKCFKHLQKIDITGTSVKVKEMSSEWRLCPEKTDSLMSITNEGWASEAVQKWETEVRSSFPIASKLSSAARSSFPVATFLHYSREKIRSQAVVQDTNTVSFVPGYRLTLQRNPQNETEAQQGVIAGDHTQHLKMTTISERDDSMDSIIMDLYKVKDKPS